MRGTKTYPVTTPKWLWSEYQRTYPRGAGLNINDALLGTIANDVLQLRSEELEAALRDEARDLLVRERPNGGETHARGHEE